jgi:ribosomal protection tetracycline resistance protein
VSIKNNRDGQCGSNGQNDDANARYARTLGAVEFIAKEPNPFLATVGPGIEPAPIDSGLQFEIPKDRYGTLPLAFFTAVEESVRETLRQGLYGWEVTDCLVTMTHTGYWARQSSAHGGFDKSSSSTSGDFRNLTALVLMDALQQAGTSVYEPMQRFYLEVPADVFGAVLSALAHLGATPEAPTSRGSATILEGEIPADRVHELRLRLPRLTHGEGVLESVFERYAPVQGTLPIRPRWDNNPLNRKEFLLNLTRRV